jgi:hypothetical protein
MHVENNQNRTWVYDTFVLFLHKLLHIHISRKPDLIRHRLRFRWWENGLFYGGCTRGSLKRVHQLLLRAPGELARPGGGIAVSSLHNSEWVKLKSRHSDWAWSLPTYSISTAISWLLRSWMLTLSWHIKRIHTYLHPLLLSLSHHHRYYQSPPTGSTEIIWQKRLGVGELREAKQLQLHKTCRDMLGA